MMYTDLPMVPTVFPAHLLWLYCKVTISWTLFFGFKGLNYWWLLIFSSKKSEYLRLYQDRIIRCVDSVAWDIAGRGWPKCASFSKNKTNKTGSERGWPKWASFSKNKTNKTGSGRGWFSKNRTWPKWFSKNKTEVPTYPCGCRNWKGVLAPKVQKSLTLAHSENCTGWHRKSRPKVYLRYVKV